MTKSSTKDEKEVPASGVEAKKRKGSLKNQLRCKKRLLSKITDEEVKAKIENEMKEIEEDGGYTQEEMLKFQMIFG